MQTSNVLLMGCQRVLRIFIGDNRIGHDIMGLTAMLYFRYCIPHMGKVTYTLQDTLRVFQGVASRSTESQKCQSQGLSLSLSLSLFLSLSLSFEAIPLRPNRLHSQNLQSQLGNVMQKPINLQRSEME